MSRKHGSNSKEIIPIKRIKFEKQDHLLVSRPFSNGREVVRLVLNTEAVMWLIIDAATGHVYETGGKNIHNLEVLQRNAKKALEKFLDANFMVEKKKKNVSDK